MVFEDHQIARRVVAFVAVDVMDDGCGRERSPKYAFRNLTML